MFCPKQEAKALFSDVSTPHRAPRARGDSGLHHWGRVRGPRSEGPRLRSSQVLRQELHSGWPGQADFSQTPNTLKVKDCTTLTASTLRNMNNQVWCFYHHHQALSLLKWDTNINPLRCTPQSLQTSFLDLRKKRNFCKAPQNPISTPN